LGFGGGFVCGRERRRGKTGESRLRGGAPTDPFGNYEFGWNPHDFGGGTDTRGLGRCFAFIRVVGRCLLSYELVRSSVFFPDKKRVRSSVLLKEKKS